MIALMPWLVPSMPAGRSGRLPALHQRLDSGTVILRSLDEIVESKESPAGIRHCCDLVQHAGDAPVRPDQGSHVQIHRAFPVGELTDVGRRRGLVSGALQAEP